MVSHVCVQMFEGEGTLEWILQALDEANDDKRLIVAVSDILGTLFQHSHVAQQRALDLGALERLNRVMLHHASDEVMWRSVSFDIEIAKRIFILM